ncbi:uridine kinase [Sporothrix brasiliensis 5110]|uniref:Uridine kinase n=1 Tax=Sporothrix brasiliensis 5110 TaxID=1398154 RepID=A0A0C2FMF7_9PEZI|nr:uridine kinase [Sporothrix brasiliensis 5110]KIH92258.1 uridine kinase [Sporothrix brasiliensis 5110]
MTSTPKAIVSKARYAPPWSDLSIIGIAGSSGSGKSSIARSIVSQLNLPWVVIVSMDSFYKSLDPESSRKAFLNEFDFDSPEAIDFDALLHVLKDLKAGRRAEIPQYSFTEHKRLKGTTSIYSPHVIILEGILALHDQRILDMMDMKIFCDEDADVCLSRRIIRDVNERGRDVQGIIKQWLAFVKPNFVKYVDPQRKVADIIVPRGIMNKVAITTVVQYIQQKLREKSKEHQATLTRLQRESKMTSLSDRIVFLPPTPQLRGMNTIIHDVETASEDFIFYFDRLSALLIELALNNATFAPAVVETPQGNSYQGLKSDGIVSAVVLERGGSALKTGLQRVIPDCRLGHILIETNVRTGEPELRYQKLARDIDTHATVLLLDAQMSSGGSALMAVQVLLDHGVAPERIVLATYSAGRMGLQRLTSCFPAISVVVCHLVEDIEERWIERRYFRC